MPRTLGHLQKGDRNGYRKEVCQGPCEEGRCREAGEEDRGEEDHRQENRRQGRQEDRHQEGGEDCDGGEEDRGQEDHRLQEGHGSEKGCQEDGSQKACRESVSQEGAVGRRAERCKKATFWVFAGALFLCRPPLLVSPASPSTASPPPPRGESVVPAPREVFQAAVASRRAAARSTIHERSPSTTCAGQRSGSRGPASTARSGSALSSPLTRKAARRAWLSTGGVSVMRKVPCAGTHGATTRRSRSCTASPPGKSDAVCASFPRPSSTRSNRGHLSPASAAAS